MSDSIALQKAKRIKGEITVPPDKSMSHRAIMFASLAKGKSTLKNFLMAEDPISTMNAMRMLGIEIEQRAKGKGQKVTSELVIYGKGLYGLKEPFDVIDCGNSGTTVRLLSGILAGNPFFSALTGDDSLKQRPMARVISPLKEMGAEISARDNNKYLPMAVMGKRLRAINYIMPVASAQVKSCLILAGLYADGVTEITEPQRSRDHTERMLRAMGADIEIEGRVIRVQGFKGSLLGSPRRVRLSADESPEATRVQELNPFDITVPADFSSAAFFIAASLLVPNSEVLIKDVCINPTRTGMIEVIKNMSGDIALENIRNMSGEPVADICCKSVGGLKAVKINEDIMPSLIDEFPIICVLATQAKGITEIRGAGELRVKESDRIRAMAEGLRKMGAEVEEYKDGLSIKGNTKLKGASVDSYGDHRIAMAFSVAALIASRTTTIKGISSVNISFPGFFELLKRLTK
ncbi:MAG: 3-phosphoshikimate 1-carboxyvinyltransferase [Nitrospirae bacterium]|nr:3-phosphoshikimate 1-carboxyvinyltransferase [Nitrospirota bacterium]